MSTTQVDRLRAVLRDLVALSTIPAAWVGRQPATIATGLADVLVAMLSLDFAFVRLRDPIEGTEVEVSRGSVWPDITPSLETSGPGKAGHWSAVHEVWSNGTRYSVLMLPIGIDGEGGLVVVGCSRPGFPSETDQLLLSVGANHAATACQNARLIHERRVAEDELRRARDELKTKVTARTAALHRTTAELQAIFDGAPVGIALLGEDLTIQRCNRALVRLLGRGPKEIVGHCLPTRDPLSEQWVRLVRQLKPGGGCASPRLRVERRNGSEFVATVGCARLLDDQGEAGGFVLTVLDISGQTRAENALRKVQQELAHVTRMTTLGELVASIGHEIRQPLTAITANAEASLFYLDNGNRDVGALKEALRDIADDGRRAAVVIQRLRQLAMKHDPQLGPVDINEAIAGVIPLVHSEALQHNISVRAALAPQLPCVDGDRVQLQQVLLNLVVNAIEAMTPHVGRNGEVVIQSERQASRLRVSVQDSGIGLDPNQMERIFDAFFTTKQSGMGMGLSISRSIIERHGGRLWAAANRPRGATFFFELPVGRPERAAEPQHLAELEA